MSAVLNFYQELTTEICCNCGMAFAMPKEFQRRAKEQGDKRTFYCPSGHPQHYVKGEIDRLKEQLNQEREQYQKRIEFERNQTASVRRELTTIKGQLTKTKKRVSKGICPCCNRSFANLHRHMDNKHPDYAKAESAS